MSRPSHTPCLDHPRKSRTFIVWYEVQETCFFFRSWILKPCLLIKIWFNHIRNYRCWIGGGGLCWRYTWLNIFLFYSLYISLKKISFSQTHLKYQGFVWIYFCFVLISKSHDLCYFRGPYLSVKVIKMRYRHFWKCMKWRYVVLYGASSDHNLLKRM